MENNFDLKKYDKKVALNYRWLGEQKPVGLSENAAALYGEACHYLYAGKLPENSSNLYAAIRAALSGDCAAYSVKLLAEAAIALTEYSICLQGEGDYVTSSVALATAARALTQVSARAELCGAEDKLFALDAAARHYVCAKSAAAQSLYNKLYALLKISGEGGEFLSEICGFSNKKSEAGAEKSAEKFVEERAEKHGENPQNCGENMQKSAKTANKILPMEALLRLASAIFTVAVYENSPSEQNRAADILNLCLTAGLTQNYSAKNDYFNPTYADTAATATLFALCVRFYKLGGEQKYLTYARRIWYNGLQLCQRAEGCAGNDSAVINKNDRLCVTLYACPRVSGYYAEALAVYAKNKDLFAEAGGNLFRDGNGKIFMGDKIFAREESGFFGKDLIEIPTLTAFDKDVALQLKFNIFA